MKKILIVFVLLVCAFSCHKKTKQNIPPASTIVTCDSIEVFDSTHKTAVYKLTFENLKLKSYSYRDSVKEVFSMNLYYGISNRLDSTAISGSDEITRYYYNSDGKLSFTSFFHNESAQEFQYLPGKIVARIYRNNCSGTPVSNPYPCGMTPEGYNMNLESVDTFLLNNANEIQSINSIPVTYAANSPTYSSQEIFNFLAITDGDYNFLYMLLGSPRLLNTYRTGFTNQHSTSGAFPNDNKIANSSNSYTFDSNGKIAEMISIAIASDPNSRSDYFRYVFHYCE